MIAVLDDGSGAPLQPIPSFRPDPKDKPKKRRRRRRKKEAPPELQFWCDDELEPQSSKASLH